MLLCGVISNFYAGRSWTRPDRGPAVAWFCFSAFWYAVVISATAHLVRLQYAKLARLAADTDVKRALLPLRVSILTILSLWVCYPVVWVLAEQSVGLLFSTAVQTHNLFKSFVKIKQSFTAQIFKSNNFFPEIFR